MKNLYFIIVISLLFSCDNNKQKVNNFQKFIDVDINADYKDYFAKLSTTHLELLKTEYKTQSLDVVFDSIVKDRHDLNDSIKKGVYRIKNYFVDSLISKEKNVRILKYRNSMFDTKNQSELFKEKIVIEVIENHEKKYIPYNPISLPQIDSIIRMKFSSNLIDEISQALKFKKYTENSTIFKKTEKRFEEYISLIQTDNLTLFNYVYPPIFQSLLASNNQTQFTTEQKSQLLDNLKKSKKAQKLEFKRYLIAGFKKTNCSEKDAYLLDYAIDVGKNMYIPGRLIVIHEKNEIYFIEFNFDELKDNFPDVFSENFIICLKNSSDN